MKKPDRRTTGLSRLPVFGFATGVFLCCLALVLLAPLAWLVHRPAESSLARAFWIPSLACGVVGVALTLVCRSGRRMPLSLTDGAMLIVGYWVCAALVCALPFALGLGIDPLRALFESVSGLTTTGLSVVDVERCPLLLLFFRSWLQFIGGAGFAIVVLAAIIGPFAPALFRAEGHADPLKPHIRRSAGAFLLMYGAYAAVGTVAYVAAGIKPFEAVCHSFSALSTGGFSTRAASIAGFSSLPAEAITLVMMVLGATSFSTHFLLWQGRIRAVWRNGEMRVAACLVLLATPLVFLGACRGTVSGTARALWISVFETVSAITTTGYTLTNYAPWGGLGIFVLIILMSAGGGVSSTAGGIKQLRLYLLVKSVVWDIRQRFLPRRAVVSHSIWKGEERLAVTPEDLVQITNYIFLYLATYVLGVTALLACGLGLREALFEFASALATTGLSTGATGPLTSNPALAIQTLGMFLGRLEILVILIGTVRAIRGVRRRLVPR